MAFYSFSQESLQQKFREDAANGAAVDLQVRAWAKEGERLAAARREAERARVKAEQAVHRGPRGGKYRVVNGRKRYDVA